MTVAKSTLMAGDGFNDSGALATATVGIAMGSGEQINLDSADVLIPGQDPMIIAKLVEISKRTRKESLIQYRDFNWSYNFTCNDNITWTKLQYRYWNSPARGIRVHRNTEWNAKGLG